MILPLLLFFAAPPVDDLEANLKKLTQLLVIAQTEAADPVSSETAIYQGAIPGMLRKLDPHSVFFDPGQYEQLKQMERSEQKGFGTIVSLMPGRVIILQAMAGTPSAKAGLTPGDEILAVNNIALNRLDTDQLMQLLSAARQQQAALVVRRPGNARLLQFVLDPELVNSPSVDRAFMLRPDAGYIRVNAWEEKTGKDLKAAIDKLGGENLKGLVLDLRANPGGAVQSAIEAAGLFLKPGQKILSVKGRSVQGESAEVPKTAKPYTFPLAVLINAKTASASEILTGALQDHDRAVVVGETSYGKGLVQSVIPMSSNTAMALTTAFYYTPSGRSIQKPLETGQLEFVPSKEEYHTDSGRVMHGGGGIQPDYVVAPALQTRLQVALEVSGSFTSFATDYTQKNKITDGFQVTPGLLDDFKVYVSERGIQPPVGEWSVDRDWIQSRLQQEILNQGLSVAKGDEVEAQRDPQVRAALERLK